MTKTWNGVNAYDVVLTGTIGGIYSPTYGYVRKTLPPGFTPSTLFVKGDASTVGACTGTLTRFDGSVADATTLNNCCDGVTGLHVRADPRPGWTNGAFWFPDKMHNGVYTDVRCTWKTNDENPADNWASCAGITVT
jgi:hypothetical protein